MGRCAMLFRLRKHERNWKFINQNSFASRRRATGPYSSPWQFNWFAKMGSREGRKQSQEEDRDDGSGLIGPYERSKSTFERSISSVKWTSWNLWHLPSLLSKIFENFPRTRPINSHGNGNRNYRKEGRIKDLQNLNKTIIISRRPVFSSPLWSIPFHSPWCCWVSELTQNSPPRLIMANNCPKVSFIFHESVHSLINLIFPPGLSFFRDLLSLSFSFVSSSAYRRRRFRFPLTIKIEQPNHNGSNPQSNESTRGTLSKCFIFFWWQITFAVSSSFHLHHDDVPFNRQT